MMPLMIGFFHYKSDWEPSKNSFCSGSGLIISLTAVEKIVISLKKKSCQIESVYDKTLTWCAKHAGIVIVHSSLFKPMKKQSPHNEFLAEKDEIIAFHQLNGDEIYSLESHFNLQNSVKSSLYSRLNHL